MLLSVQQKIQLERRLKHIQRYFHPVHDDGGPEPAYIGFIEEMRLGEGFMGYRKFWHALRRAGHGIARCTVARLMREMGFRGVVRGKEVIATNLDAAQPCPARCRLAGIDLNERPVRARFSQSGRLAEKAAWRQWPDPSQRPGSQHLSIRYTGRLDACVGTVGDSYDNALAETILDLFKAEVINRLGPWKSICDVEREPSAGSTAATIVASSAPSDTSHPQKPRKLSMKSRAPVMKPLEI